MVTVLELISPKYAAMQRLLHAQPRGYGGRGDKWAETVVALVQELGASSVLDYGCGQGSLKRAIRPMLDGCRVDEYDPGIPEKAALPSFAELVVCTDVLEHIEPERLDAVLAHLRGLARLAVFAVISLKESNKVLADGRNAHVIIRPATWWHKRLEGAGFTIRRAPDVARKKKSHEWTVVLIPPAVPR